MRRLLILFVLFLGACAARRQRSALRCLPHDAHAQSLLAYAEYLVTSTDDGMGPVRAQLGLDGLAVEQITLVTAGPACGLAAAEINRLAETPARSRALYVVRIGEYRYAVQDPDGRAGEWNPVYVLDAQLRFLQALLGL